MTFLTGKMIPRRTFLRGAAASVSLPFLEAMLPAGRLFAQGGMSTPTRLVAIEMVHGAAGASEFGASQHLWSPAQVGRDFDLSTSSSARWIRGVST